MASGLFLNLHLSGLGRGVCWALGLGRIGIGEAQTLDVGMEDGGPLGFGAPTLYRDLAPPGGVPMGFD